MPGPPGISRSWALPLVGRAAPLVDHYATCGNEPRRALVVRICEGHWGSSEKPTTMLIATLLLLFTLICILLSADRAWDNVTKPERNELVFDGRHRGYGAFVLRREYEHRFIIAFFAALAIGGAAVMLPKAIALISANTEAFPERRVIVVDRTLAEIPPAIPKAKPETAPAPKKVSAPIAPISKGEPVIMLTKDTLPEDPHPTDTKKKEDPAPPDGGGTGKPDPGKGPINGGALIGSDLGTRKNPTGAADVDSLPQFIGGPAAMNRFVQNNIRFPNDDGSHEKEWVEFIVDADGSVVDVRAKGKASRAYSVAAEQVLRMMPKWKPAVRRGEKVACILVLPIDFRTK